MLNGEYWDGYERIGVRIAEKPRNLQPWKAVPCSRMFCLDVWAHIRNDLKSFVSCSCGIHVPVLMCVRLHSCTVYGIRACAHVLTCMS